MLNYPRIYCKYFFLSTAPPQLAQLFCIRVPLGETCVTAAYAILPSKQQSAYEECLTALLDTYLQREIRPPEWSVADYQIAIHNTVRSVVSPNIHIQVTIFYYNKSEIYKIGLPNLYKVYYA